MGKNKKKSKDNMFGEEDCITEEIFASFLENQLNSAEREKVEEHISECETCFQKSILFSRVLTDVNELTALKFCPILIL